MASTPRACLSSKGGVTMSPLFAAGMLGAVNSRMIAITSPAAATGPVQGSWPGSPQSALAVAGTTSDAVISIAAAMVFIGLTALPVEVRRWAVGVEHQ